MTQHALLLMKKLKGPGIVLKAAKHNLRTLPPAENIDAGRSLDNVILRGPGGPHEVADLARSLLASAAIKAPRKGAVQALEVIVSLAPASGIDEAQFFTAAVEWAGRHFAAPVLSAIVHNDEAVPHLHILLLPLVDGHMIGSELVGGYGQLQTTQADFYKRVAAPFGLTRPPRQERASAANRRDAARSKLAEIKQRHGLLIGPEAEADLLDLIAGDMTKRIKSRSFVGIMTKPVKPEKPSPSVSWSEGQEARHERGRVDLAKASPSPSLCKGEAPPAAPADADPSAASDYTRHRDDDVPADCWNSEHGEFIRPRQASPKRAEAFASVRAMLASHNAPTRNAPVRVAGRISCVSSPLQPAGP